MIGKQLDSMFLRSGYCRIIKIGYLLQVPYVIRHNPLCFCNLPQQIIKVTVIIIIIIVTFIVLYLAICHAYYNQYNNNIYNVMS